MRLCPAPCDDVVLSCLMIEFLSFRNLPTYVMWDGRLIAQKLAHLQSVDVAAAAAKLGDDVKIDTESSLFEVLYGWVDYSPFSSTDPQKQAM